MAENSKLRIRIEAHTQKQIHEFSNDFDIHIKKIYEKENQKNGYVYYAYGNTNKSYKK